MLVFGMVEDCQEAFTGRAVVVMGGVTPDLSLISALEIDGALVVVADSGAVHAMDAGLPIDIAVGDFDSIPASLLEELERSEVRLERHPTSKDATDLELAIDVAIREGADVVTVVGGHGGRVDQSLANMFIISSPVYAHISIHAVIDSALVSVVHGGCGVTFRGEPGNIVTLLPAHGDAIGIRTVGLEYPLNGETLSMGTTRGVSNVMLGGQASVSLDNGTLLVIRPGSEIFDPSSGGNQ